MTDPTDLTFVAGLPFSRSVRLTNGTSVWATLAECEVRGQVRKKATEASDLLLDLTPFLGTTVDGQDIVVTLAMTGAETRLLTRTGFYDVFISDAGPEDQRAVKLLHGSAILEPAITSGADA